MQTDLQFGYEIYDRCYEINSLIQAIDVAASRNYVTATDADTKEAVQGLQSIVTQLRKLPAWFHDILYAASRQATTESTLIQIINNSYVNYNVALNVLLNETGPLDSFEEVANPFIMSAMRFSFSTIQNESIVVLGLAENITNYITEIKAGSNLIFTPKLVSDSMDFLVAKRMINSLLEIRNSFGHLLDAVKDVGRLVVARGSMYELLSRYNSQSTVTSNEALNSFVNEYNKTTKTLFTSISSYEASSVSEISKFIANVQRTYNDSVVRPKFEEVQLPMIQAFSDVISSEIFNSLRFQLAFDHMMDQIQDLFTDTSNATLTNSAKYQKEVLDLLRFSYVRRYSDCLDELVTTVQVTSVSSSNEHAFCLRERTSGIAIAIPSTNSMLSSIKETVNFIVNEFNKCLNTQTSLEARTAVSECIQIVSF